MGGYADQRSNREKALDWALRIRGYDPMLNPEGEKDIASLIRDAEKFLLFLEGDEIHD